MAILIALLERMKRTAHQRLVLRTSTLVQTRSVFRQFGNVMETMTVEITQMRPRTARIGNVQQIISNARQAAVFPNHGCVMETRTV